jgi:tetratricopeptide (TPR) repeat protein
VDEPKGVAVISLNRLLVFAIAAELLAGAVVVFGPRPQPGLTPPVPDLSREDQVLAAQVHDRAAKCQTPKDWNDLGELYLAHGFFPEAEACCRVAAEMDPNQPDPTYDWAFALERIGRLEESNAAYTKAIELGHADPAGCWYFVGRNHLRREDVNAARAAFEKAGDHPSARYEIARLLVREGKPAEAVPILDRLAAKYPNAVQPPLLRHRIEVLAGSPQAAAYADRSFRAPGRLPTPFDREFNRVEAIYFASGRPGQLRNAQSLLGRGDWQAAGAALRELLQEEWDPYVADSMAEAEFHLGRPAEAARLVREVVDRAGPSAYFLIRLGDEAAEAGRQPEAVEAWTRATRLGSPIEVKNTQNRLAMYYDGAKNEAAAKFHHGRAFLGAGEELFRAGQYRDALPAFKLAAEHDPRLALGWFYAGETHRVLGEAEPARAAYRKCLEIDPDFGRAVTGLGLLPPG